MDGHRFFSKFRYILAELYLETASANRIVSDAGLNLTQIPFDPTPVNYWHNILVKAIENERLDALLTVAIEEYRQNEILSHTYEAYQEFTASGGSIEVEILAEHQVPPPPEPSRPPEILGFIGRDSELRYFAERIKEDNLAVITGMPGVGKTALASKLTGWVADHSERIFWHSFHEGEGVDTFIWSLAGFLAWHDRSDVWQLLQSIRLSGGKLPPVKILFDNLVQLLTNGNFLLCFDDFHNVYDDTELNHIVDRLTALLNKNFLSIIITSRHTPNFVRFSDFKPLEGLSIDDTNSLLVARGIHLTEIQIDALHANTAGNVEFLTLAIEALRQAKDPDDLISHLASTDDVAHYLLNEVDDVLSGQERTTFRAVAVLLGHPATRDAIEAVLNGRNIWRVLHNLYERHLLIAQETDIGRTYSLHAILREFYYESISRRQRRTMHHQAGNYYADEETDLLLSAIHFERAGEYERAVEQATTDVWEIINRGKSRTLEQLLDRIELDLLDSIPHVQISIAQGEVYTVLGEEQLARHNLLNAWSQLAGLTNESVVQELRARNCQGMGSLLLYSSPKEALDWLLRGLSNSAMVDNFRLAQLRTLAGAAYLELGEYSLALESLEHALNMLPPKASWHRGHIFQILQLIYLQRGDLTQAESFGLRGLKISQQVHHHIQVQEIISNLGVIKFIKGDWQGGIADFQKSLTLAEQLGNESLVIGLTINLGLAHLNTGDDDVALRYLSSGLERARQANQNRSHITVLCHLADLYIRKEQPDQALQYVDEAEQLARQIDDTVILAEIYRFRALIAMTTENYETAHTHAEQSVTFAREAGMTLEFGMSLRVLGQTLINTKQLEPGYATYEESIEILDNEDPYETARTKMEYGLALLLNSNLDLGRQMLNGARSTFQKLGAKRDLQIIEKTKQFYPYDNMNS